MSAKRRVSEIAVARGWVPPPKVRARSVAASAARARPPQAAKAARAERGDIQPAAAPLSSQDASRRDDLPRQIGLIAVALAAALLVIMAISWQFLPKLPTQPQLPAIQAAQK